jgi:hypothetical protein
MAILTMTETDNITTNQSNYPLYFTPPGSAQSGDEKPSTNVPSMVITQNNKCSNILPVSSTSSKKPLAMPPSSTELSSSKNNIHSKKRKKLLNAKLQHKPDDFLGTEQLSKRPKIKKKDKLQPPSSLVFNSTSIPSASDHTTCPVIYTNMSDDDPTKPSYIVHLHKHQNHPQPIVTKPKSTNPSCSSTNRPNQLSENKINQNDYTVPQLLTNPHTSSVAKTSSSQPNNPLSSSPPHNLNNTNQSTHFKLIKKHNENSSSPSSDISSSYSQRSENTLKLMKLNLRKNINKNFEFQINTHVPLQKFIFSEPIETRQKLNQLQKKYRQKQEKLLKLTKKTSGGKRTHGKH